MEYRNMYYTEEKNANQVLDIFLPDTKDRIPIFIYFHGGGLESGDKDELPPEGFLKKGIGVVSVNYRMYPYNRYPDFIWDCTAAVNWTFDNIEKYANISGIFVGGSSAGAYIAMMICFDSRYFKTYGIDINKISGFVFNAGQTTTHFNVLRERGIDPRKNIVDDAAPLYYIDEYNNMPPMLIYCAEHDMTNRYEHTMLLIGALKQMNYPPEKISFEYIKGHGHCDYINDDSIFADKIAQFIFTNMK